jgi:hypothetical protein
LLLAEVFCADVIRGEQTQEGSSANSSLNCGTAVSFSAFDNADDVADSKWLAVAEAPDSSEEFGGVNEKRE